MQHMVAAFQNTISLQKIHVITQNPSKLEGLICSKGESVVTCYSENLLGYVLHRNTLPQAGSPAQRCKPSTQMQMDFLIENKIHLRVKSWTMITAE